MRLSTNQLTSIFSTSVVTAIAISMPAFANSIPEGIAQDARESVVQINSKGNNSPGGSGVIIDEENNIYTVLTANHVVCDALNRPGKITCSKDTTYSVRTHTGRQYAVKNRQVLQKGKDGIDLAIITFEATEYYSPAIPEDEPVEIGADIFVAGFPAVFGKVGADRDFAFTGGRVVSYNKNAVNGYSLIYDANTLTGNSGGPVFDINGRLIGIHGLADASGKGKSGFNAAIPINTYLQIKEQLRSNSPEPISSSEQPKSTTNDSNLKILQNLGYTPITCDFGRQIVSIMIYNRQYCVDPIPPLTQPKYRYNPATKELEVFDSTNQPNPNVGL
ncbi:serine protease [Cronbergia sp. UHCC 0137]|uniref:S1 family peptidase n=1 Tax=Cronbergia sp. UHCC 0137 TaxID=3110239 RepID=UPI002B202877|nr:serine protease [Cronbergia sp. UHCC 0137]MEA5618592.1 serine protease [Cronbergia sp. UHCC 0137]